MRYIYLGLLFFIFNCASSEFRGKTKTREIIEIKVIPKVIEKDILTHEKEVTLDTVSIAKVDRLNLRFSAAKAIILEEVENKTEKNLDLVFVLDSTQSMMKNIIIVRDEIESIVENLRNKSINLRVGVVGFMDSLSSIRSRTFDLTDNISDFKNFLDEMTNQPNDFFPEASLLAIKEAINLLRGDFSRTDAVKTMLLITDVIGHNGMQNDRTSLPISEAINCSVNTTVDKLNVYISSLSAPNLFKFYYVIPDPKNSTSTNERGAIMNCLGKSDNSTNVKTQMEEIINKINPSVTQSEKGGALLDNNGNLAWPLSNNTLGQLLTPLLQVQIDTESVKGTCLAKKIELFADQKSVKVWEAIGSVQLKEYVNNVNGSYINFNNALKGLSLDPGDKNIRIDIERCCVSSKDIKANNFARCHQEKSYKQSINFVLETKSP